MELSTSVANLSLNISTKQVQMSCCLRSAQIVDHIAMLQNSNNSHDDSRILTILSTEDFGESVTEAPSKRSVNVRLEIKLRSI